MIYCKFAASYIFKNNTTTKDYKNLLSPSHPKYESTVKTIPQKLTLIMNHHKTLYIGEPTNNAKIAPKCVPIVIGDANATPGRPYCSHNL